MFECTGSQGQMGRLADWLRDLRWGLAHYRKCRIARRWVQTLNMTQKEAVKLLLDKSMNIDELNQELANKGLRITEEELNAMTVPFPKD